MKTGGGAQTGEVAERVRDLASLHRAHYDSMVRLATLLIGSQHRAEELVQDCFVRLHPRFEGLDDPVSYLRRSVVNACRSAARRQRLEARRLVPAGPEEAALSAPELTDVLLALPARQRAALVLRYYADLSGEEIASVLGCRPGTVKSLIHRGLAHLREVLGE